MPNINRKRSEFSFRHRPFRIHFASALAFLLTIELESELLKDASCSFLSSQQRGKRSFSIRRKAYGGISESASSKFPQGKSKSQSRGTNKEPKLEGNVRSSGFFYPERSIASAIPVFLHKVPQGDLQTDARSLKSSLAFSSSFIERKNQDRECLGKFHPN